MNDDPLDLPITTHELSAFGSDFFGGGYSAECYCGWASPTVGDMNLAAKLWSKHSGEPHPLAVDNEPEA